MGYIEHWRKLATKTAAGCWFQCVCSKCESTKCASLAAKNGKSNRNIGICVMARIGLIYS